jgi:hypothetical protein
MAEDRKHTMVFGVMIPRTRMTARMVLGLVVMGLGALWTLDNLGLVESEPILRWWPALIVALGLGKLLGLGLRRQVAAGVVFTLIGTVVLAGSLGLADVNLFTLWPLSLILVGFAMLARSAGRRRGDVPLRGWFRGDRGDRVGVTTEAEPRIEDASAQLGTFAIWSGVQRKVISQEFRGGEVTAVMGGAEVDLRGAKPVEGGAVIDVFVCWGGVDFRVPDHWKVVNEATVLMGAVEDKSKTPPPDARETLIVRGMVVMGGVEIKN